MPRIAKDCQGPLIKLVKDSRLWSQLQILHDTRFWHFRCLHGAACQTALLLRASYAGSDDSLWYCGAGSASVQKDCCFEMFRVSSWAFFLRRVTSIPAALWAFVSVRMGLVHKGSATMFRCVYIIKTPVFWMFWWQGKVCHGFGQYDEWHLVTGTDLLTETLEECVECFYKQNG